MCLAIFSDQTSGRGQAVSTAFVALLNITGTGSGLLDLGLELEHDRHMRAQEGTGAMWDDTFLLTDLSQFGMSSGSGTYDDPSEQLALQPRVVGDQIDYVRSRLGFNVKQIAELIGVARATLYTWTSSGVPPRESNARMIARLVDIAEYWGSLSEDPLTRFVNHDPALMSRITRAIAAGDNSEESIPTLLSHALKVNRRRSVREWLDMAGIPQPSREQMLERLDQESGGNSNLS